MRFHPLGIVLLLMAGSAALKAQYNSGFLNYSNTGRCVSVSMDADAGSNGLSNRLADKLAMGGYIDDDLKKQSASHLRAKNNFGATLNYGVSAFIKATNNIDLMVGLKDQVFVNSTYTRDLFNLVFYGNQMYQGKAASLANCSVNLQHFQEIKLGAIFHVTDSATKLGISLSFVKGQQMLALSTNSTSNLYTSADGSQLQFSPDFILNRSNPGNTGYGAYNGLGASGEVYYETTYESKVGKKSVFIANLGNLGAIFWKSTTQHYSSDSSFNYSGYSIKTISDLKDSTLKRLNQDSVLHRIAGMQKKAVMVNLPVNFLLMNKVFFSKGFAVSIGLRYIFNANYLPYVFVEPEYRRKKLIFGLHTGYGGYTRLNVGASVTLNTRGWFVKLGSNSIQGYLLPKSSFSQGVFFSLAKKLK